MQYSQGGNIAVIAAMVAEVLNKVWPGFGVTSDSIVTVILGIVAIVGVIKQWLAHKKLAQVAGVYPR